MTISRRIRRLMAYVYMPLIFTILGYLLIYIAFKPIINIGISLTSMIMAQEVPNFNLELESIYVEPEEQKVQEEIGTQDDTNSNSNSSSESTSILDDVVWPGYGQHYAQISCDRVGLLAPLYMGDDNAIMKVGAGQYLGSFPPGYGRVILVAAHCTTFFKPLQYVETGDVIVVKTSYGIYEYKVNRIEVYKADDMDAYDLSEEKEQLIMYTCYPFRLLSGSRQQRMFVYADKISGPSLK